MKAQQRERARRGFSLLEMMVSTVIMGLVLTMAALMFRQVIFHYLKTDTDVYADREVRFGMARVCAEVRQASQQANLANPPAPVIEPLAGARPLTDIKFFKVKNPPGITAADFTKLAYDQVEIQYDAPNRRITESWNADPTTTQVLASNVTAFTISAQSAGEYTIDLTVQAPTNDVRYSSAPVSLESTVYISYYRTNTTTPG